MHSDPGAPVALSGANASPDASRRHRIPFELLAAITIVGVAAAGHFVAAALVAIVVVLGRIAGARLRASMHARAGGADEAARAAVAATSADGAHRSPVERALSTFAAWFMPLAIALAAAVLMRTGDIAYALTLLLVASPQALHALPVSSLLCWRALAALAAAALLGGALAGIVGLVAAAVLQQASTLVAHVAAGTRAPA